MTNAERQPLPAGDSGKFIGWRIHPKREEWYDTARICINGHVINEQVKSSPHIKQRFCDKCGAPSITKCKYCHFTIKGPYHTKQGVSSWVKPSYCPNCGKPYPWTELTLKAARELTDTLKTLTTKEREALKKSLDDIVQETPRAPVAVIIFKKLMAKAGPIATEGFKIILSGIVSVYIQRIWPL